MRPHAADRAGVRDGRWHACRPGSLQPGQSSIISETMAARSLSWASRLVACAPVAEAHVLAEAGPERGSCGGPIEGEVLDHHAGEAVGSAVGRERKVLPGPL